MSFVSSVVKIVRNMKAIDRQRLKSLMQREQTRFVNERPKSKALFERAGKSLLGGVPMNWMIKWAGAFPPFVREAQGAQFYDVDGLRYIDFCLGDTGAMTGHSPFATVKAVEEQCKRGITLMLPSEDAIFVAEELQQRFGLPFWQFALTATDANRFAIRLARQITQRPKILVFNWCYHGTVDESFITLKDGVAQARRGNIGPPVDPAVTTKVVEFNDVAGLEQALAPGDVACVLAEPVMTNVGIVHPEPGYHQALRDLTGNPGRSSSSTRLTPFAPGPEATPGLRISIPTSSFSAKPLPAEFRARPTDSRNRLRTPSPKARTWKTAIPAALVEPWRATRFRSQPCGPP